MYDVAGRLEDFKKAAPGYGFWNNDYSFSEWLTDGKISISSAQSTDAYLLQLCERNGGIFATFDRRIKPLLIGSRDESLLEYIPS